MPTILPTPQQTILKNNRFKITNGTKIILGTNSKQEQFAAQQINDEIAGKKEAQLKIVAEHSLRRLPASFIFIGKPRLGIRPAVFEGEKRNVQNRNEG